MKKIITLLLTVSMVFAGITCVYAQEPQMGSSTLTYTVDDSFWVYIPETMPVGQTAQLQAGDLNIDPSKQVYVSIANIDGDNGVKIYNVNDSSATLSVKFKDANGNTLDKPGAVAGEFSSTGDIIEITPYVESDWDSMAGDYTGTVYFNIYCE